MGRNIPLVRTLCCSHPRKLWYEFILLYRIHVRNLYLMMHLLPVPFAGHLCCQQLLYVIQYLNRTGYLPTSSAQTNNWNTGYIYSLTKTVISYNWYESLAIYWQLLANYHQISTYWLILISKVRSKQIIHIEKRTDIEHYFLRSLVVAKIISMSCV